ncbi:MAG: septum formation initiator family protein [Ruminiclostridium sp.]
MSLKQKSEKMHKRSFILSLAIFAVLAYTVVNLVSMQVEIAQKSSEYEELSSKLDELLTENEQLERYSNEQYRMDYIEEIAREELDYSYADEKIYYFVPSN